jgi:cytosine/creatinine deaminase
MLENNDLHANKTSFDRPLIIKRVRPMGGAVVDVLVSNGYIQQITDHIEDLDGKAIIYDGCEQLLLPGLVNAHAHVDKNLIGLPWQKNQVSGSSISDLILHERHIWNKLGLTSRTQSSLQVRAAIAAGTTHIRSHVDIDPELGPKHFEGVLETRAEFKEFLSMQLAAFPQGGLLTRPGALESMESAIQKGADCVGGIDPSTIDRDPVRHLDTIFGLADRYGVEVDIHLHEPGMLGGFAMELISERTKALSFQGRVTISHAFCLGMVDENYLNKLIDLLLINKITIMSAGSGGTPLPPLKRLNEAGVTLCTGTDGVRDMWSPYNSVDMLDRVKMLGYRNRIRNDEDIEMLLDIASNRGARIMGDPDHGVSAGKQADLIVVPGDTPAQAVIDQPLRTFVFKRGQLVAANGKCFFPE